MTIEDVKFKAPANSYLIIYIYICLRYINHDIIGEFDAKFIAMNIIYYSSLNDSHLAIVISHCNDFSKNFTLMIWQRHVGYVRLHAELEYIQSSLRDCI